MLNRIQKLNQSTDYNNSKRNRYYKKVSTQSISNRKIEGDTKIFSPVINFLQRINWKLLNLVYNKEESIFISFSIEEYEFSTAINLLNISNINYINYKIISRIKEGSPDKITAQVKTGIINIKENIVIKDIELKPFNIFFHSLKSLNNLDINTNYNLLNNLFQEVKNDMYKEFNKINSNFIVLIQKLVDLPISSIFDDKSYKDDMVILENIKRNN